MLKVMLVDDDVNVRECLKMIIPWEELGCTVISEAANGEEALEKVLQNPPNIVLTDLRMPVMDGSSFCKKLREQTDDIVIIFMSAYENFTTAQLALKYNVTEYLLKPFNVKKVEQLKELLRQIVQTYQRRSFFERLLQEEEQIKEVIHLFQQENGEGLDEFFEELSECGACDFLTVRLVAVRLLRTLYDFLRREYGDKKKYIENRNMQEEQLSHLGRKADIVTYVAEIYREELKNHEALQADCRKPLAEQIKQYVEENFTDVNLNVSTLAQEFHFSSDYISRVFREFNGGSLNEFIADTRMRYAIELLGNEDVKISNISQAAGYGSSNYFARLFKSKMNITPTEYRMKMLRKNKVLI